jgi:hypothetical protein
MSAAYSGATGGYTSRTHVVLQTRRKAAVRKARGASSTWWHDAPYPTVIMEVNNVCSWTTTTLAKTSLPGVTASYVRIRMLQHSTSSGIQVPTEALHKPFHQCTPMDRLVDIGFVQTGTGAEYVVTTESLQAGLLAVYREHMTATAPRCFAGYRTKVCVLTTTAAGQEAQLDTDEGLLHMQRSSFSALSGGGTMLLLICVQPDQLWTAPLDHQYPMIQPKIDLALGCEGWLYAGSNITLPCSWTDSQLTDTHRRNTSTSVIIPLSMLVGDHINVPVRCNPGYGSKTQWFWAEKSAVQLHAVHECTLADLSMTLHTVCTLLTDFAVVRSTCPNTDRPSYGLWYTRVSRAWSARTRGYMNTAALVAARQILFGVAAKHSSVLFDACVAEWVELCRCIMVCQLEEGNARTKAHIVRISRARYQQWGVKNNGTIDVVDMLGSSTGCRLLAKHKVRPIRGRVHLADVPELALGVTLEHLSTYCHATHVPAKALNSSLRALSYHTRHRMQRYLVDDLHYRSVLSTTGLPDDDKMDMATFLKCHSGVCLGGVLVGDWRLGDDARYCILSILRPYVRASCIMQFMQERLHAQWQVGHNHQEKYTELLNRLSTLKCSSKHRGSFFRKFCLHVNTRHYCIYGKDHPIRLLRAPTKLSAALQISAD